MKTKFTPGPWRFSDGTIRDEPGRGIAEMWIYIGIGPSQREANAALIAAAPDLYAFAQEFLRVWAGPGRTDSPLEAQARAALAKAEGSQ